MNIADSDPLKVKGKSKIMAILEGGNLIESLMNKAEKSSRPTVPPSPATALSKKQSTLKSDKSSTTTKNEAA